MAINEVRVWAYRQLQNHLLNQAEMGQYQWELEYPICLPKNELFISILNPTTRKNDIFLHDTDRVLRLKFWDADPTGKYPMMFQVHEQGEMNSFPDAFFNEDDVNAIYEFIDKHKDTPETYTLNVHCKAGNKSVGCCRDILCRIPGTG